MNPPLTPRFQWRAFTSILLALAFVLLALSGSILFLSPPGRVANWTNWSILGLRKSEWTGLHIWFSTIFLAMTCLHAVFNWRPFISYLKDHATRRLAARREWALAGVVALGVFIGTRAAVPPFSSFLAWSEGLKESWDQPAARAPIPHAELLTLAELAGKAGVDSATAVARLNAAGIAASQADLRVQAIAEEAHVPAQKVYDVIRTNPKASAEHGPGAPGGGLGWKTLRQFCADERIDLDTARARLRTKGIVAEEAATLREIATNAGQKPYDLVTLIRTQP